MKRGQLNIALLVATLVFVPVLSGQSLLPDYPVRVTFRDSAGEHRLLGRLATVTADSLQLRVANNNTIVQIDRQSVLRLERRRGVPLGKLMIGGCIAVGAILGVTGSQLRDPHSPGIEKLSAAVGFVAGCGIGALAGAAIGSISKHYSWEEIRI